MTGVTLTVAILDLYALWSATKLVRPRILTPKRHDDHPRHFYMGVPPVRAYHTKTIWPADYTHFTMSKASLRGPWWLNFINKAPSRCCHFAFHFSFNFATKLNIYLSSVETISSFLCRLRAASRATVFCCPRLKTFSRRWEQVICGSLIEMVVSSCLVYETSLGDRSQLLNLVQETVLSVFQP